MQDNLLNNPLQGRMKPDISYYHKDVLGSISMITGKNTYRHYNARSMRWMTVDPVKDGMNWYSYVNGDPINLYDPLGLCDADPDSWRNVMKEQQPMMRGDDVEELQESLDQLDYDVEVDGYYGSQTAGAVKQYQQDKGLEADGVVGPNTRDAIKKDLGIEDESNKVTIEINRTTETSLSTIGELSVNGEEIGYSLELPWKDNKEDISRIPPGEYPAHIRKAETSERDYDVIELEDVPGRENVQMHIGNEPDDTKGCILTGKITSTDWVGNSTTAHNEIMEKVDDDSEITVIIKDDF